MRLSSNSSSENISEAIFVATPITAISAGWARRDRNPHIVRQGGACNA
ncbi:MAG: hypothetical protein WA977_08545 [Halobacteriota archaeon]